MIKTDIKNVSETRKFTWKEKHETGLRGPF